MIEELLDALEAKGVSSSNLSGSISWFFFWHVEILGGQIGEIKERDEQTFHFIQIVVCNWLDLLLMISMLF